MKVGEDMKQKRKTWSGWGLALLVGVLLVGAGCTAPGKQEITTAGRTDKSVATTITPAATAAAQQALSFYHKVSLDALRSQVESCLGVTGQVQADGQVAYLDPASGYGVLVDYGGGDQVFAKRLLPKVPAPELAALNPEPVTDKQAYRMAQGMPFYEVQEVMGSDGIEVSLSRPQAGSLKQVSGLGWFNPDGSYAVVYLNLPEGLVAGSEFVAGPS